MWLRSMACDRKIVKNVKNNKNELCTYEFPNKHKCNRKVNENGVDLEDHG